MDSFSFYFTFGWKHIMSSAAADHLLFLLALSAVYQLQHIKRILVLITAFTIGHSLTLLLSAYNWIKIPTSITEFLIPLTIIATATLNLISNKENNLNFRYTTALFFGLIHGLGFAGTIRFMLFPQQPIAFPLLSFNLGIELAQIVVIAVLLFLGTLTNKLTNSMRWWLWSTSAIAIIGGLWFAAERLMILNNH